MVDGSSPCRKRAAASLFAAATLAVFVLARAPLWLVTGPLSVAAVAGWSALGLYSHGYTRIRWLGIAAIGAFTPVGFLVLFGPGGDHAVLTLLIVQLPYVAITALIVRKLQRSVDAAREYWIEDAYEEHPLDPTTWGHLGRR